MTERNITREEFRYGYQGNFAEEDEETGWNSFELRMYDAVIGRWMATDPKKVGFSPYIGMGNNPLKMYDPDGGAPLDGYRDSDGNYVWFDDRTSESFVDNNGTEWNKVTDNYGAWIEALTILEGNISFLTDMGYDPVQVRKDVQLLNGDHEYFTKFSTLNNSSNYISGNQWSDAYSITGTGLVRQSTFSNMGYSIKYYQDKGAHENIHALGIVKSNFFLHSWEAGWEVGEFLFFPDDAVMDMHFANPFNYNKSNFVNSMMRHTEIGFKTMKK
ncbi:hypothetical protein LVD15_23350 [Fulvivirga maritima]|nr:hypothetical protein LVD15_23350 [Fulvivirga maritima]